MGKKVRVTSIDTDYTRLWGPTTCARCQEDIASLTLYGGENCHYCGNEINLCRDCAREVAYDLLRQVAHDVLEGEDQ